MNEEIAVTVYCATYNHVNYIRSALEGFVNQKTNFKYQVIVHDDASTDGTTDIVRKYAEKYPDIIVPIIQKENQYSKNIPFFSLFVKPKIAGRYIATCEGDDYWCDDYKLQKQFDVLENNKSYVACVHNTLFYDVRSEKKKIKYQTTCDKILPIEGILSDGGHEYHTSSLMYRKEYIEIPDSFKIHKVGDYPRAIYLALSGDIYYLKDVMSVYRYFTPGSWTSRQTKDDHIRTTERVIEVLDAANIFSDYRYHDIIDRIKEKKNASICLMKYGEKELIKNYPDVIREYSLSQKIKLYIKAYFPFVKQIRHAQIERRKRFN